jgi:serine/threonine protein kinase/tetratricopeptide (TPR) repeat protein
MSVSIGQPTQSFRALPLHRISALCEEFANQLSENGTADFVDYLGHVGENARVTLLRNMLHIDLRRRRNAGEQPSQEQYIARLPQFAGIIREEFQASTQQHVSLAIDTVTEMPHAKTPELPSVVRLGEYVLERELGRGAMGVVFAARHVRHGARVALKTLPTVAGPELHRFKREFRSVADMNHPNLVGLHNLQADGGQWFFTMDLVDGADFLSYVRPNDLLDIQRLRDALSQLATAVNALHVRGIVHRDIKPSNVMVSREGRLRLLDFGLVLDDASREDGEAGGTPAYMAPEQTSLVATTPASDWYAIGVMLYQALVGELPFDGSVNQILRDKRTRDVPPIRGNCPEDLAMLCRRLLSRNSQDRPDRDEVLRIVCPGRAERATVAIGSLPRERLMGREQHLRHLERAIRSFENQEGARTIFISGRSGEGKTVLAEHFLEQFRSDPAYTVLAGRCYDRESVPFKAVDTLIDALCARLKSMPEAEVAGLLTADAAVLADLFPVLNRVAEIARLPRVSLDNLELERVRRLAADALREILRRLAQSTKLVCFIDDLQWGDADSAKLLLDVLRPPGAPRLLLLGTYRSDEAESSRFLQAWNVRQQQLGQELVRDDCRLEPLSTENCIELVIDIVGVDDEAIRQRAQEMAEETGGNPFLLSELASCYDPDEETSHPMRMEEVMERKLTLLPADARSLLDVVSVSGKALPLDEAARTAGHVAVPLSTITRMRTERLLRMAGTDKDMSIDTYHDRIRETVLRDMDTDSRKSLHVRLAEQIEASMGGLNQTRHTALGESAVDERTNPRVYDLAYHFFEGGDSRAFDYQLQAGEAATRAYALENAIGHLKKAEQIMPDTADPQTRYRLWERLGEACGRTQRLQEALRYYETAQPFASNPIEQAAVHDGIGEMYHRMGKFDHAIVSFDEALKSLGYHRANWLPRVLFETIWLLCLCQFMWLVPRCKTEEKRNRVKLASQVFHRVGLIFLPRGDVSRFTHACARFAFAALRSGYPGPIAFGFGKLGFNNAGCSLQTLSKWMLARAMRFAEQSPDPTTKAGVEGIVGGSLYCLGQLEEAERRLRKSLNVLDRQGESFDRIGWYHHLRHVYSVQGHSEKEMAAAEMEKQIGEAAFDPETICWAQYGLADAKARMGRLAEAHEHIRRSLAAIEGRGSRLSESVAFNHYGFVCLQSSDYHGAVQALDRSRGILERSLLYLEYVIRTYPWLVESLVGPNWLEPRQDAEIRRATRVARRARFFAWRFPNIRPHTLRVRGRLLCARGRPRRAMRCFQNSIESARQLGAEYDLARSLLDLAAVADERRDVVREEAVAILKRLRAVIPHAEKWLLGKNPDESCVAPNTVLSVESEC